jgi:hypothetical protein
MLYVADGALVERWIVARALGSCGVGSLKMGAWGTDALGRRRKCPPLHDGIDAGARMNHGDVTEAASSRHRADADGR